MSKTNRYEVTVTRTDGRVDRVAYIAASSLAWTVREIESFGDVCLDVNGSRFEGTAEQWLAANGAKVAT